MDFSSTTQAAEAIGWFYALSSASRIAAYAPQVALIRRCPEGARSVSLITWGSATLSHLAALAYGLLIVNDLGVAAIGAGNLIGCAAILGAARQRRGSVAVH